MAEKQYIHIRNWDRYQHTDAMRGAGSMPWVKDYTAQLHDDDYLNLTAAQRGILHGLRLMYASSGTPGAVQGLNQERCRDLLTTNRGDSSHFAATIKALSDAGCIVLSASKVPARRQHDASTEGEVEVENPLPPLGETAKPPTQRTPKPRRPKHPDQMTHEEKKPYQCGIGKCTIRHATQWKIEEHREVIHRIPPAQNGHVEPEVALARADLFGDTEPDLEEEA